MALNTDSNGYTIGFAAGMVVVVGALLAFVAMSLKPAQKANVENEKKQFILNAINIPVDRAQAGAKFGDYVKKRVVLDYNGNVISEKEGEINATDLSDAFNIDVKKEYKKYAKPLVSKFGSDIEGLRNALSQEKNINYPLFVCENEGKRFYVVPVHGTGLWADVWGYIGMDDKFTTVNGAVFDHKSETPGLGAEIAKDWFGERFVGKTLADENGKYTSIRVVKPGTPLDNHKVDGITGGTFTGVGVDEMIDRSMIVYYNFIQKNPNF